eukprot:45899-Pyramimonas_sp.AAC.1
MHCCRHRGSKTCPDPFLGLRRCAWHGADRRSPCRASAAGSPRSWSYTSEGDATPVFLDARPHRPLHLLVALVAVDAGAALFWGRG